MGESGLERTIQEIDRQLNEVDRVPATTLDIIGEAQREKYWESLLVYFLEKDNPHGFGTDILAAFLEALTSHDATSLSNQTGDLSQVEIQTQVPTGAGPLDILLWLRDEWYVAIELKVRSPETGDQTARYANSAQLGDLYVDRHSGVSDYVYLAPAHSASPVSSEFDSVSWQHVVEHLEQVLINQHGQYPSKSRAQFADFIDTIKREFNMTDLNEISKETELYSEYSETIDRLRESFEDDRKRILESLEASFFAEVDRSREDWETSFSTKYIKIYKKEWHRLESGVHIEYEPYLRLKRENPQISLKLDIEYSGKHEVRERLRESLGEDLIEELTANGWEITDGSYGYIEKSVALNFDDPSGSIHHAISELHEFREIVEPHIDEIVANEVAEET